MATVTRKQREMRDRERLILQSARELLISHGYLGLRMDDIAQQVEYSKGTIYQHFPNKEEVILALANQALTRRTALFSHAVTLRSKSRERLAAVGAAAELFVECFADFFQVEQIVRIRSVWEKTTKARQKVMRTCEQSCVALIGAVVRDAMKEGDLTLPKGSHPEDIVFGLWSMNSGAFTILQGGNSLDEIGMDDAVGALRRNQNAMLDGYGWRPLSTDLNYDAVLMEVKEELVAAGLGGE